VGPRTGLGAEESNHNCPVVRPIAQFTVLTATQALILLTYC